MPRVPRLVVLGRPGAGKGTQCTRLARHYGVPHVSTGEILRTALREGTEVAATAREDMDAGTLLADEVVVAIVEERLAAADARDGFIIDGFPRTVGQAEALVQLTAPRGIDLVIDLRVPEEVARSRLAERWTGASGTRRSDDAAVVAERRLEMHEAQAGPVAAWFARRGQLLVVDGCGQPDEVTAELLRAVDQKLGDG